MTARICYPSGGKIEGTGGNFYTKGLNMTLILTCLTKDFLVQASDRRLTRTVGGKVELDDDDSNKALIYSNHFVFAYTGWRSYMINIHLPLTGQRSGCLRKRI
jgi:hypothetical protein